MKSFREPKRHTISGSRILWTIVLVGLFTVLIIHYTSPRDEVAQQPDGTTEVWRSSIIDLE
ncbi:MAG: hypothetical protein K9N34_08995 [Candidatus Marinimicrobia bacterium]|nr:hypothetical protein [Candidatus Neomarinimicrobiota bacterium]MCF7840060.1 hypothetical protein [Candidatus Neomarinimicrobiota bacterium]MCF7902420.1 hypothetical protein [Candidatus Neomarinimicrobiota bacterium]